MGYRPWGCKELDTTEQLTLSLPSIKWGCGLFLRVRGKVVARKKAIPLPSLGFPQLILDRTRFLIAVKNYFGGGKVVYTYATWSTKIWLSIFQSLFYYTQKQKVISSHGLNDWLRRRWSKNHSLGGGCLVSMSITNRHLREFTHTSVGYKYDTVPCFWGWLALDQEGKSSHPADDSTALSSHPDLLKILPIFFFKFKPF